MMQVNSNISMQDKQKRHTQCSCGIRHILFLKPSTSVQKAIKIPIYTKDIYFISTHLINIIIITHIHNYKIHFHNGNQLYI